MARPTKHEIRGWLTEIEKYGGQLTAWEETFVSDMQAKSDREEGFSEAQEDRIRQIWEERVP